MTTYTVTITEAPALSSDATLISLKYGNQDVPGFAPDKYVYNIEKDVWPKSPPQLSATPNSRSATVEITQPQSAPGSGKVEVTAQDGVTKLTYTVNYTVPAPSTDLALHVPEIYEAKEIAGGYGGTLTEFGGHEYEVYYINRDNSSNLTVATSNADKAGNICDDSGTSNTARTKDGWLTISCNGTGGDTNAGTRDEFAGSTRSAKFNSSSHVMEMHIQGYDQFSFYGNDNNQNPSKGKMFEVYIDDVKQAHDPKAYSINRFDLSSGEHVIRLTAIGGSDSKLCSFSLRLSQEPRTKRVDGNDSSQVVLQMTNMKPVVYATKYNNIPGAQTRLLWEGTPPEGIGWTKTQGTLSDTLVLGGVANCPVGEYRYHIVAYYNGQETNRVSGKFKVSSSIVAKTDVDAYAYTGEEMDQIVFSYYALSPDSVILSWPEGQEPAGISGHGANGKYFIGGTPTDTGTFPYTITTVDGDTTIQGSIIISTIVYSERSVLYIQKDKLAFEKDAIYKYLNGTGNNKWDMIYRKQKEDGLRPLNQYANYKWILISENVDANNPEVLGILRGNANLPVLNLKGFTYSSDRLDWGEPDNGAIDSTQQAKKNGTKLYVQQPGHPVFSKMGSLKEGDSITVLSNYEKNGLMPINVDLQGTLCLGTAYTRDMNDYYGRGEQQTALHEIPADKRNGHKYICLPMARNVTLDSKGKSLLDGIVAYLTSTEESGIELPELKINSFELFGVNGKLNQTDHTITISLPQEKYDELEDAHPVITLADPHTHVTPSVEGGIDLRTAVYFPKTLVVTDYINRCGYSLTIEIFDPEGIENVYETGQWVNIYDVYGRKVATTNENIYQMELPRGMYIIVTENGETLKIMR